MATRIERAREFRRSIDSAGMMLTDKQALECKALYRQWEKLIDVTITAEDNTEDVFKFMYGDELYKFIGTLPHTFRREWEPGVGTESLYTRIDEEHAGTVYDPIPYEGNMELVAGLYYVQGGVTYLCTRDTGVPVYNALADLVGIYVQPVEDEKSSSGLLEEE